MSFIEHRPQGINNHSDSLLLILLLWGYQLSSISVPALEHTIVLEWKIIWLVQRYSYGNRVCVDWCLHILTYQQFHVITCQPMCKRYDSLQKCYANKPATIWIMQIIKNLHSKTCWYRQLDQWQYYNYTKARSYKHWRYSYKPTHTKKVKLEYLADLRLYH